MAQETLSARVDRLESVFRDIAATRMQGVPLLHPGVQVQAVGFAPEPDGACALGVLVTPWFMNLMRLPLAEQKVLAPGEVGRQRIGEHPLSFIGAHEAALGPYEMCSLASPMFEFADHAAAVATAREVLACLRAPVAHQQPDPQRRRFLLGRAAAPVAPAAPKGGL